MSMACVTADGRMSATLAMFVTFVEMVNPAPYCALAGDDVITGREALNRYGGE
jgi:hypothetical protein